MALEIITIEGREYEVHSVTAKNGETGTVNVAVIPNIATLQELVDDNIVAETDVCKAAMQAIAIKLQANWRSCRERKKVPKQDANRIAKSIMTLDVLQAAKQAPDYQDYIDNLIYGVWIEEQENDSVQQDAPEPVQ